MDTAQHNWLKEKGLAHDKSIVDCDPISEMVTLDDGTQRQCCQVYTRVMGYHRPVQYFNAGKQQEHRDRKWFRESSMRAMGKI